MSGRTIVRLLGGLGATALAVGVGIYVLNPLRTASHDPRLPIAGYAPFRTPSRAMQPALLLYDVFLVSAWPTAVRIQDLAMSWFFNIPRTARLCS